MRALVKTIVGWTDKFLMLTCFFPKDSTVKEAVGN